MLAEPVEALGWTSTFLAYPGQPGHLDLTTVFEGKPERMTFGELAAGSRRQITGHLKLDSKMAPGHYILQVMVSDLVGEARTASQFTDFQVRE